MKNTGWVRLLSMAAALNILVATPVHATGGDDSEKTRWVLGHSDLVPFGTNFAVPEVHEAQTQFDNQAQRGGEQIKTKSPLAGFLLGGIVGFGTGQFYSKRRGSGYFFLGVDLVFTGVAIGGLAAGGEQMGEGFLGLGGLDELYAAYVALLGLGVSHGIQAIWGAYSAAEYNKSLLATRNQSPLESGGRGTWAIRLCWRF